MRLTADVRAQRDIDGKDKVEVSIEIEEAHHGYNSNVPAIPKGHVEATFNEARKTAVAILEGWKP